ncbi:MAG: hypothetical protein NT064_08750 [Proteobacteria bacterium]|nr:hypothetical protein [Pseudomonadota bacterium]
MEHLYTLYDALVSINVPSGTARQVVQAMERDMTGELATKSELQNVRNDLHNCVERCRLELHADIDRLRQETTADIDLLRQETKADIDLLRQETKADIDRLRQETRAEFVRVNHEMGAGFALIRSEIQTMSKDMTIKLGSMMVAMAGLVVTIQKLL